MVPFLAFQCSECRADDLARIFVTPAPDFGQNEAVESSVKFTLRVGIEGPFRS
jgi:hypothetical protein